jgi:glycosyltransferase involved in cell wall biosynthesis
MKIEFIIPTYNRPNNLMCVINSIYSQRSDKWKIHVIADGPQEEGYDKVVKYFEGDERIKFTTLEKRHNDWGHTPRNYGLENATEEWVVMSGDDNYYTPVFVDHFLNAGSPNNVHFVYCDMVHNWTQYQYHLIKCAPHIGRIDIGNFMVRREFGQQMKIDVTKVYGDGLFVEEYLKRFPNGSIRYIEKPLYVHN